MAGARGLGWREGHEGVAVERGEVLAELQDNPILDAFVALHDREREAFAGNGAGSDDA